MIKTSIAHLGHRGGFFKPSSHLAKFVLCICILLAFSGAPKEVEAKSSPAAAKKKSSKKGSQRAAMKKGVSTVRPLLPKSISEDWSRVGLDLSKAKVEDGKYVQRLKDGSLVTYTLIPELQKRLEKLLDGRKVPHGGAVLLEPDTGKVLALVSSTRKDPYLPDIAQKAAAPSASVFKIITGAALVEAKGISLDKPVCYHGGLSRLTKTNIVGDPKLDKRCDRGLGDALAFSTNSIVSKLAYQNLSRKELKEWGEKFGYNAKIPFELPVEVSRLDLPKDPIERARAAAGFWHSYLSPLHAAMIGATLANDGVMMKPAVVEKVVSSKGKTIYQFKPQVFRRSMSPKTAKALAHAMERTTRNGTARNYFRFRNEFPSDKITVSGKTGTLSRKKPSYLGYTWFAGYGEDNKTHKRIAVAGLVCNLPIWHIRGPYVASEAVRIFFDYWKKD